VRAWCGAPSRGRPLPFLPCVGRTAIVLGAGEPAL